MEPFERAAAGLFLGFQYPVEIPGVSSLQFLRESLNSQRRSRGEAELSGGEFIKLAREQAALLGMSAYILIAIQYEERDLRGLFGKDYETYRSSVGMLIPRFRRPAA